MLRGMPTLRALAEDLHTCEDTIALPGGVRLPIRATVIRLPDGGTLVHSPTPIDDALAEAVTALGPVRFLVAPNVLHHLSLGAWQARFPAAALWAAPGLARKRPDLAIAGTLGNETLPFAEPFEPLPIAGCPGLAEHVFFHAATRTLVASDLLFHVLRPANLATRLVLTLAGTSGRLAMSRVLRFAVRDRAAFRASVEQMLARDFLRFVPGHGDVVDSADGANARERCREALAWALAA